MFLRSLLVGYLAFLIVIPLAGALSVWQVIKARRHGRRRPALARVALFCGSALIAILGAELAAASWLAWIHRMPWLPTQFATSPADQNEISLVVIGGSSALGYPYDPKLSVGQIVAWQIEQAMPGRRVVLDIRAQLAKNLEDMHKGLANLNRRPDAMIIYSGHNEFLSRFDTSRDAGYDEVPDHKFLHSLYQLSLHSPLCQWFYELVRNHRLGGPPPLVNQHQLIDVPAFTPSELQELLTDFRRRLEDIVGYCERIGAIAILVIPPANESGFEPNRNVLPGHITPTRRKDLTERFTQARQLEEVDPSQSLQRYRSLLAREPEFAEVAFRLGRLLERSGAFDEARAFYIWLVTWTVIRCVVAPISRRSTAMWPRIIAAS